MHFGRHIDSHEKRGDKVDNDWIALRSTETQPDEVVAPAPKRRTTKNSNQADFDQSFTKVDWYCDLPLDCLGLIIGWLSFPDVYLCAK